MPAMKERMNLYIAKPLMEELRRAVPARERTKFIEEILARELKRKKLRAVLKKSFGAWKDENHPELATYADVNRWVAEGRKKFTRNFSKEWAQNE